MAVTALLCDLMNLFGVLSNIVEKLCNNSEAILIDFYDGDR